MKQTLKTEHDVQAYTRLLKNFYGELYSYVIMNGGFVLVWLFGGAGYFWPIWIIVIWGISLLIKASKLHIIDSFFYEQCHAVRERVLFFKKDWEEEKTREIVKKLQQDGVLKHAAEKSAHSRQKATTSSFSVKKSSAPKGAPSQSVKHPAKKTSPQKTAELKAGAAPKKTSFQKPKDLQPKSAHANPLSTGTKKTSATKAASKATTPSGNKGASALKKPSAPKASPKKPAPKKR